MPALGEYPNVYNTALAALRAKGFQIWRHKASGMFCAERDGWDFMAESPISLLGLVAIFEHQNPQSYKEYWWRNEAGEDFHGLPTSPAPYTPVWRK